MKNKKNITELNTSLSQLSKSINTIKSSKKESTIESDKKNVVKTFSHAFRIVSELFANVLVGASIGWGLDYFLTLNQFF